MDRVIPPFYACYLLRSTVRHQNIYVGSTPNPVRRLRQHNGLTKGGAARTSRDSLRPWEMTCLVTGFPSKIAALQFEWAWQNTHLTRHIAASERITQAHQRSRVSPKSGRIRKRIGKPRVSLTDKLANLHILLRANSFERWPLQVKFFAPDVFRMWERCAVKTTESIRPGIRVELDQSAVNQGEKLPDEPLPICGIHALDVTFRPMKDQLERGVAILSKHDAQCSVCKGNLDPRSSLTLICVAQDCGSAAHMTCLADRFLAAEGCTDFVLPVGGDCPSCGTALRWMELVMDLSLRIRGEKERQELFRQRRSQKKAGATLAADDDISDEDMPDEESDLDLEHPDLVIPIEHEDASGPPNQVEGGWLDVDDVTSNDSLTRQPSRVRGGSRQARPKPVPQPQKQARRPREAVIEDSDWDEAEVIE